MRVLIATTIQPFIAGGDAVIVDSLEEMLTRAGHEVEVLRIPFDPFYPRMPDQMLGLRLLDVSQSGDRLIAIRTPSYLLRHPNKVLWFIHHHRGAYDFWGTEYGDIPDTAEGRRYRRIIRNADQVAFAEARRIFTNSRTVSARLKKFNNVDSQVLYPPLLNPEQYVSREYGDYFLYLSRIVRHKRQHLAVEALSHTHNPVRLIISGGSSDPEYVAELRSRAESLSVADRLTILDEWIPGGRKLDLLADCLAAIYLPFNEDSYGYCALEAQQAAKAVMATHDSGGPLELIDHDINGILTDSNPRAIAAAMDTLWLDRSLAQRMGLAGRSRIEQLGIGWEPVLSSLLS